MRKHKMRLTRWLISLLALTLLTTGPHAEPARPVPPLANAVILIIRHAEKPDSGPGLTPLGQQRALAYVHFFQTYRVDAQPLRLDRLIAAADTAHSQRPRLTLEPLSKALRIPLENRFQDKEAQALAGALQAQPGGRNILICWHHGEIPELIQALGANPAALLPQGRWPSKVYGWVIELQYDPNGHIIPSETRRINEHLLPDDGGSTN